MTDTILRHRRISIASPHNFGNRDVPGGRPPRAERLAREQAQNVALPFGAIPTVRHADRASNGGALFKSSIYADPPIGTQVAGGRSEIPAAEFNTSTADYAM